MRQFQQRFFSTSSSASTKRMVELSPTATLTSSFRHLRYAPKPDDHDAQLERLKRSTWSWERANGPMKPHRYYSHDPSSWKRKAGVDIEDAAGVGPDKLPLVQRTQQERQREQERRENGFSSSDDHVGTAGEASSAAENVLLPLLPSTQSTAVGGVKKQEVKEDNSASSFDVCLELCSATWDLLRVLLRPTAVYVGKRAKATAMLDLVQTATLLQDAALLLVRETESDSTSAGAVRALVADSWLALHFAAEADASLLKPEAMEQLRSFKIDFDTQDFRADAILAALSGNREEMVALLEDDTKASSDAFSNRENLDVTAFFVQRFVSSLPAVAAFGEKETRLLSRLVVALDFAASRFAAHVAAAHRNFQQNTPDRGVGQSPVDAITLRWLVSAVGALRSVPPAVAPSAQPRLERIIAESLDQVLYLTPNRDVPVKQLILATAAARRVDDPLGATMELLCLGMCRRLRGSGSLARLRFGELARIIEMLASQPVPADAASGGGDADAGSLRPSPLRNAFNLADYGSLLRNTLDAIYCSDAVIDGATAGAMSDLILNIGDIAARFPQFRIDIVMWREMVDLFGAKVAAATEGGDEDEQQVASVKATLLQLRAEHCFDSGGNGRPTKLAMTENDATFLENCC